MNNSIRQLVRRVSVVLALCATLTWHSQASALERPQGSQLQKPTALQLEAARALGNHDTAPQLVQRLNKQLQGLLNTAPKAQGSIGPMPPPPPSPAPLPAGWSTLPNTGNVKVLALLIAFQDYPSSVAASTVQSMLFADGNAANFPRESLRRYYERSSYGQLSITGNVLGWYTAGLRSSVSETTSGREALIKQALNSYEAAGHDFTQYDNDGDGKIDYLIVMWTGPNGAWASFWWGYQTGWTDSSYMLDGKRLGNYSWQWESSTPTVVIHETGHALGLPDYYDYDGSVGPDGGLGGLDMMDANNGDHNCFSKFLLGWLKPTLIGSGSGTLSLEPSSLQKDCLLVTPSCEHDVDDISAFSEFYLIENRTRMSTGNDKTLPGDGLLIWHIDSQLDSSTGGFAFNNSYTSHKLIRVMEADGLEEIENGWGADLGDYWSNPREFSSSTTPACKYYDGSPCPFEVTNLSAAAAPMTLDVSYSVLPEVFCMRDWYIEARPLCQIIDCGWLKPGDDVINPPDYKIRELIDLQSTVTTPGINQNSALGAAKAKQQILAR